MGTDILARLRTAQGDFSRGQKAIAAYITDHYDKAAFMTAYKLGTVVGVSESTVVRFAVRLGYEGYPDLQGALQDLVRNRLTAVQRLEVTTSKLSDQNILQAVMNDDVDKITTTLSSVDQAAFNGAVQDTIEARRIYIIGMRSSAGLAQFLKFYFQYLFENVHLIVTNSTNELYEQLLHVSREDMIYGISFPRYSSSTVKALQFVKSRGARVVAITDSAQSPITPYADYALFARSDMASFVDSLVAPMSLINALIIAIGMRKKDEVSATFAELEHIWEKYGVYETYEGSQEEGSV
ncbi:MAG: MurR/RpiR family transcriptional regulator [Clostridia bacterium]|nr:MurR/RpiR family transcriptional regulator [Oscillospiraceae bacterium]MBR6747532.1 MurR/RpiR family transcriptional regulator [Clostridia bacterium]